MDKKMKTKKMWNAKTYIWVTAAALLLAAVPGLHVCANSYEQVPESGTKENNAAPSVKTKPADDSIPAIIYVLIGGVVIAIGVAAAFWYVRQKKEQGQKEIIPASVPERQGQKETIPASVPERQGQKEIIPVSIPERQEQKGLDVQFWLAARGGYMNGRMYPIGPDGITIGREEGNTIQYPKEMPGVSRTHARLSIEKGRLLLTDCHSSNGTFIRGIGRLQPQQSFEVSSGDVFYIGEKKNGFEIKSK